MQDENHAKTKGAYYPTILGSGAPSFRNRFTFRRNVLPLYRSMHLCAALSIPRSVLLSSKAPRPDRPVARFMRLYTFGVHDNVEPLPQSAPGVERSMYSAALNEAMKLEIDGHEMTATYEAATFAKGRHPVGASGRFPKRIIKPA